MAENEEDRPRPAGSGQAADFPVVGIGCSAGGLGALEKLFSQAAADSGMAYVVVQHLAPEYPSALPDLLQRLTAMPVLEAAEGMPVRPDCVYVIPPNNDLSLIHGVLHLSEPPQRKGWRLPVDHFLRSLAEDRCEKAVGVILSGMGADGVSGLRAVKDKGGLTVAQEPGSASSEAMPRAVIDAGVVDIIALPEEIPARITGYLRHPARNAPALAGEAHGPSDLDAIAALLRVRCGADFSLYKTSTLLRRIERRVALNQLGGVTAYVGYLRDNPQECTLLFRELLIGVTSFFRNPEVWEYLRTETLPALLGSRLATAKLRAWVPACSSGEEAYSLAMLFREAVEANPQFRGFELVIYATDLDPEAIARARKALYPASIVADVPAGRLARFFVEDPEGYRIRKEIREMVVFATQNIISDPPFTRVDMLLCRNFLIYVRPDLQKKLVPLFHYALNAEGILVLGSAETVGHFGYLFAPVNFKARIFRRVDAPRVMKDVEFPSLRARESAMPPNLVSVAHPDNLGQLTDQLIQQNYAPAAVLVNGDGDILYISGRVGKYLEPPAGKVNVNVYAMAREGLREALIGTLSKALREPQPIQLPGLRVGVGEATHMVDVTVQALERPEALRGRVLIVFRDVAAPASRRRGGKSVAAAAHEALLIELNQTREALQVTHDEMQSTFEELKSSNEELHSTNEELQSTNEELTTSREEMQSLNEELQTVNAELQSKVEDLTWVRNDMRGFQEFCV